LIDVQNSGGEAVRERDMRLKRSMNAKCRTPFFGSPASGNYTRLVILGQKERARQTAT
jgi:hypothetical protein